jgi:MFS family permease
MSPVATFLYEKTSMQFIFFLVAGITLISIVIESLIRETPKTAKENACYSFSQYKQDILEGFSYLKKEKGIRNIYTYMAFSGGTYEGTNIAIQAYYQSNPLLTVTMLGFLRSAEMLGRMLSGFIQYKVNIPPKKRYGLTVFVYTVYQIADMILLFSPYPLMLANRFLCGGLGNTSATVRETAVQAYLPENIRARVNALFSALFSIGGIFFQVIAGILGELMPYRAVILILGIIGLVAIGIFIILPHRENRTVYEAVRTE